MTYDARLIEETMRRAGRALREGDHSRANRLLQRLHSAGHASAESHRMLATIGAELGLFDHAVRHADDARRLQPPPDGRERFLVIRAWGAGFWADVSHTVIGLAFAEASGRTPIIHWGRECRYRRAGIEDAWRLYFEPVSTHTIATAEQDGLSIFPPKWTKANLREIRVNKETGDWSSLSGLYLLKRDEDVAVFDFFTELDELVPWLAPDHPLVTDFESGFGQLYRRYVRPTPQLSEDLARFEARLIKRRPTIAAHFRTQGPEKVSESSDGKAIGPESLAEPIDRYLAANADAGVYLMTDFAPAVAYFRERYGDRLACREVTRIKTSEERSLEIHPRYDGVMLGREVVLDTFLAVRCDAFVGDGASGVSWAVRLLKDWPEGAVTLLRKQPVDLARPIRNHADPSAWWNPPA